MTAALTLDDSLSTRAELTQKLHLAQAKLEKARRKNAADAIAYAATPDGAAETFRRYELSRDEEQRRTLRTTYLSGLSMAEEEYEERLRRGNASDNDGPLAVVPVGDFSDPLTRVLVEHRVMGTYRTTPTSADGETVAVTLLRLMSDQQTRKRLRIVVAAEAGTLMADLADIIAATWTRKADKKRLHAFLNDAAEPVAAAIEKHGNPQ